MSARIEHPHPLYGAEVRLARARRLIGTMDRQYQRWADEHSTSGWDGHLDRPGGKLTLSPRIAETRHIHLPRISITVGETAYNIRAALDYLVYSIARANNDGVEVSGTQFPIEDHEWRYWMRWTGKNPKTGRDVPKWLNKIPKPIADDLASYQPFAKCEWVRLLRDISNLDKHRHLSVLTTEVQFISDRPILRVIDTETNRQTIDLRGEVEISVTLETGEDILGASKLVERETRALIRSYASILQSAKPHLVQDKPPTRGVALSPPVA